MKRILGSIFLTLTLLTVVSRAQETPPPPPHFFDLNFGTVQYKITGAMEGTETLYFDQAGMRQAHFRVVTTQEFGTNTNVILKIGEETMLIDPNKRLGQKSIDLNVRQALANHKPGDPSLISTAVLILEGAVQGKGENVLDRPCEVWENEKTKTKVWVWKGIPLKIVTQMPQGKVVQTVKEIDEASPVDEKNFTLPEGVHFINQDINQILLSLRSTHE